MDHSFAQIIYSIYCSKEDDNGIMIDNDKLQNYKDFIDRYCELIEKLLNEFNGFTANGQYIKRHKNSFYRVRLYLSDIDRNIIIYRIDDHNWSEYPDWSIECNNIQYVISFFKNLFYNDK